MSELDLHKVEGLAELFNVKRVESFYRFLNEKNDEGGFFSKSDYDRIGDRHVIECMAYIRRIMSLKNVSRETKILDVGSGPGLPGFLFACLNHPPYVTLLDSSKRRLSLVEKYWQQAVSDAENPTKNNRLKFLYQRAEEYKGQFDVVTMRALIPFPYNAILVRHLVKDRIAVLVGESPVNQETQKILEDYRLKVVESECCKLTELNFLGERNLIIVRKIDRNQTLRPVVWKNLKNEIEIWRKL